MTFGVDQQIVWFQVAMHDAAAVKVFYAQNDLSQILLGPVFWQSTQDFDKRSTIASIEILHDKVQIVLAREGPVKLCNKVALALPHHDGSFSLDVGDLILGYHVCLLQDLDGVVFAGRLLLGKVDATKRTFTDGLDDLEVFN